MTPYEVQVDWDGELRCWFVEASDVPGLAAEAPSFEALAQLLKERIPEMLGEHHGHRHGNIRYHLVYETMVEVPAAC
jgi:predicted RNase H-like HicB family nuclease